ncbi:MAG TPA: WD40 repeat domain-containing protein [Gemmataceae bacterium]|nr:WD40 repeat domain-containing protein [Gemmataceae bacterium]
MTVWDTRTAEQVREWRPHTDAVRGLAFSPDDRSLATASEDGTAKICDVATGAEVLTFRGHVRIVYCVAFSPDGRHLATGGQDRTVRIWDATTGAQIRLLQPSAGSVVQVMYAPDGVRLLSRTASGNVKVWQAATGQELAALSDKRTAATLDVDGDSLALARVDGAVAKWNPHTGAQSVIIRENSKYIVGVGFSPDGRRLATALGEFGVKLWDVKTGQEAFTLPGNFCEVAFSPNGQLLAVASPDGDVKLWQASRQPAVKPPR